MRSVISDLLPEPRPGGSSVAGEVQATSSLPSTSSFHRISPVRSAASAASAASAVSGTSLGSRSLSFIRSGVQAVSSLFAAAPKRSGELQRTRSASSPNKGKRQAARPARARTQSGTGVSSPRRVASTASAGDSPRQPASRETLSGTGTDTGRTADPPAGQSRKQPPEQPAQQTDQLSAEQTDQPPAQQTEQTSDQTPQQLADQLPDQLPDHPPGPTSDPPSDLTSSPASDHTSSQQPESPSKEWSAAPPGRGRGRGRPGAEDLDSEGRSVASSETPSHTDTETADADERASLASEPFSSDTDDGGSQRDPAAAAAASDGNDDDAAAALSPRSSRRVTFDENAPETLVFVSEQGGDGRGSDEEGSVAASSTDSDSEETSSDSFQRLLELLRERSLTPAGHGSDEGETSGQPDSHVARYLREQKGRRPDDQDESDIQEDEPHPYREERRPAFPHEPAPGGRRSSFVETIDEFLHYLQVIAEDHKAHQEAITLLDEEPAPGGSDAASEAGDSAWSETASEVSDSVSEAGSVRTGVDSGLAASPPPLVSEEAEGRRHDGEEVATPSTGGGGANTDKAEQNVGDETSHTNHTGHSVEQRQNKEADAILNGTEDDTGRNEDNSPVSSSGLDNAANNTTATDNSQVVSDTGKAASFPAPAPPNDPVTDEPGKLSHEGERPAETHGLPDHGLPDGLSESSETTHTGSENERGVSPAPADPAPTTHTGSLAAEPGAADPPSPAAGGSPTRSEDSSRESSATDSRRGSAILRNLLRASLPAVEALGSSHSDTDTLRERRASLASDTAGGLLPPNADHHGRSPGQAGSLEQVAKSPGEMSKQPSPADSGGASGAVSESELSHHQPVRSLASIADQLLHGGLEEEDAPRAVPSGVGPSHSMAAISSQLLTDHSPGEPAYAVEVAATDEADTETELHSIIMHGGVTENTEITEAETREEDTGGAKTGDAVTINTGIGEANIGDPETEEADNEETENGRVDTESPNTNEGEGEQETTTGEPGREMIPEGIMVVGEGRSGEREADAKENHRKETMNRDSVNVGAPANIGEKEQEIQKGEVDRTQVKTDEVILGETENEGEGVSENMQDTGDANADTDTKRTTMQINNNEKQTVIKNEEAETTTEAAKTKDVDIEHTKTVNGTSEISTKLDDEADTSVRTEKIESDIETGKTVTNDETGDVVTKMETGEVVKAVRDEDEASDNVENGEKVTNEALETAAVENTGQAVTRETVQETAGKTNSETETGKAIETATDVKPEMTEKRAVVVETEPIEDIVENVPGPERDENPQAVHPDESNDYQSNNVQPGTATDSISGGASASEKIDDEMRGIEQTVIFKQPEGSTSMTEGAPNIAIQTSTRLTLDIDGLGSVTSDITRQESLESYSEGDENESENASEHSDTNETQNDTAKVDSPVDDDNAHTEALALLESEETDESTLPNTVRIHAQEEDVMSGTRKRDDQREGKTDEGLDPSSALSAGGTDEPRQSDSQSSMFSDLRSEVSEYITGSEMDPDDYRNDRIRLTSDGESATTFDEDEISESETITRIGLLPNKTSARKLVWSLIAMASGIVEQVQGSETKINTSKIGFPQPVEKQKRLSQVQFQETVGNDTKDVDDSSKETEELAKSDKSIADVIHDQITKEAERNHISMEQLKEMHGPKVKEIIKSAEDQVMFVAHEFISSLIKQTLSGEINKASSHEAIDNAVNNYSSNELKTEPHLEQSTLTQNNGILDVDQNLAVKLENDDALVDLENDGVQVDLENEDIQDQSIHTSNENVSEQTSESNINENTFLLQNVTYELISERNYFVKPNIELPTDDENEVEPSPQDIANIAVALTQSVLGEASDIVGDEEIAARRLRVRESISYFKERSEAVEQQRKSSMDEDSDLTSETNQDSETPAESDNFDDPSPDDTQEPEATPQADEESVADGDATSDAPPDDMPTDDVDMATAADTTDQPSAEPIADADLSPDDAPAEPQEETTDQPDEPQPPAAEQAEGSPLASLSSSAESDMMVDEGQDTLDSSRIRYETGEIADQTQNVTSQAGITAEMLDTEAEEGAVTVDTDVAGQDAADEPAEDAGATEDGDFGVAADADDDEALASDSKLDEDGQDVEPEKAQSSSDDILPMDDMVQVSVIHADEQDDPPLDPELMQMEPQESDALIPPMILRTQSSFIEKDILAPELLAMKESGSTVQEREVFADQSALAVQGKEAAFDPDAADDGEKDGRDADNILAEYADDMDLESSGETEEETTGSESSGGSHETLKDEDVTDGKDSNVFDWLRRVSTQMDQMGITDQLKEMYGDDIVKPIVMAPGEEEEDISENLPDMVSPKIAYSDTGMYHESSLSLDTAYRVRQSSTQTDVKQEGRADVKEDVGVQGQPGGGRHKPCGSCPCCLAMKRVVSGGDSQTGAGAVRRRPKQQQRQQQQRPWTSPTRSVGDLLGDASSTTMSSTCTTSSVDGGDSYERRMKHPKRWLKQATDEFMRRECIRQVVLKNDLVSDGRIQTKVTRISRHTSSMTDCLAATRSRAVPGQSLQMEISKGETVVGGRTINYQDVKIRTPKSCSGLSVRSAPRMRNSRPAPQDDDVSKRFIDTYLAQPEAGSQSGRTSRNGRESKTRKKITIKTDCRKK